MTTSPSIQPSERYLTLAIAQSLIRNGYIVHSEQRHYGGFVSDLSARDPKSGKSFIIEIKFANSLKDVESIAEKARQRLPHIEGIEAFVAIGVPSSQTVFVDSLLLRRLKFSRGDFTVKPLKKSAD